MAGPGACPAQPHLKRDGREKEIRQCYFWSYTWFWPVVMQGGEVMVALRVARPGEQTLWEKSCKRNSPGVAAGGSYGFELMAKDALTKVVADIAQQCASPEFRAAVAVPVTASK